MHVRRVLGYMSAAILAVTAVGVVSAVSTPTQTLALPGASESTVITVAPARALDTRIDLGLPGKFTATGSRKLQVTGQIDTFVGPNDETEPKTVIPTGATGILMNVTAVAPTAAGFITIRPGNATGEPGTASLNFVPGDVVPNAVTVQVPTSGAGAGQIDIAFRATSPSATIDIVVDIVGYTTSTGLVDLTTRVEALEASGTGGAGPKGDTGPAGPIGPPGVDPARVVWVAESGGDFTSLSTAMAATTGPAVIKIAPGTYVESAPVTVKNLIDIEGSGRDVTTVQCACTTNSGPTATTADGATIYQPNGVTSTISNLTVANNGASSDFSYGIKVHGRKNIVNVAVEVISNNGVGILAVGSGPAESEISNVDITVFNSVIGAINTGQGIYNHDSNTPIANTTVVLPGGLDDGTGVYNDNSDILMTGLDVTVRSGNLAQGIYNDDSDSTLEDSRVNAGKTIMNDGYGVASIDSDIVISNSFIESRGTNVTGRAVAVFTTRTGGSPRTTIRNSVLESGATSGSAYGAYSTGSNAHVVIFGSEISGKTFSVRGRAYLESSVVNKVLDPSSNTCFNVRIDDGFTTPIYDLLDEDCDEI